MGILTSTTGGFGGEIQIKFPVWIPIPKNNQVTKVTKTNNAFKTNYKEN